MKIEHRVEVNAWPGMILDHQEDRADEFSKVAQWWPSHLDRPAIGYRREDGTFAASAKIAEQELALWPLDTPEDAMASALYFYRWGLPVIGSIDKQAMEQVRDTIDSALLVHDLVLPSGYIEFCKNAWQQDLEPREEQMVASGLPVTSPAQTLDSIRVFRTYEMRWPASDRIKIANKLKKAAAHHGLTFDHPLACIPDPSQVQLAQSALWAIDKRARIADEHDHPLRDQYLATLEQIQKQAAEVRDFAGLVKCAAALEEADKSVRLDTVWNEYLPDPARSLLVEHQTDPLAHFKLAAEQQRQREQLDWDDLNFEAIERDGILVGGALVQLKKNASQMVPQLAPELRAILQRYLPNT